MGATLINTKFVRVDYEGLACTFKPTVSDVIFVVCANGFKGKLNLFRAAKRTWSRSREII